MHGRTDTKVILYSFIYTNIVVYTNNNVCSGLAHARTHEHSGNIG